MKTRNTIRDQVLILFNKLFPEKKSLIKNEFFDIPLLSGRINLQARDLLCLFFDTEKEFDISIPQDVIIAGRFSTINNITDIILEYKNES